MLWLVQTKESCAGREHRWPAPSPPKRRACTPCPFRNWLRAAGRGDRSCWPSPYRLDRTASPANTAGVRLDLISAPEGRGLPQGRAEGANHGRSGGDASGSARAIAPPRRAQPTTRKARSSCAPFGRGGGGPAAQEPPPFPLDPLRVDAVADFGGPAVQEPPPLPPPSLVVSGSGPIGGSHRQADIGLACAPGRCSPPPTSALPRSFNSSLGLAEMLWLVQAKESCACRERRWPAPSPPKRRA